MRVALLEIGWQRWRLQGAHDPCAAPRAREIRQLFSSLGQPIISVRSPESNPGDPGQSERPEASFAPGFEPVRRPATVTDGQNVFDVEQTGQTLLDLGIDEVVMTGLLTGHGVRLAAASAAQRGYPVTVACDACAEASAEKQARAIEELQQLGVTIRTTEELTDALWAAAGREPSDISIAEAAELTGLSRDTLRWYEREGLIPRVHRSRSGHRRYDARALRSIQMLVRLRRTGMPVAQMRQYVQLVEEGEGTHQQRLALLHGHRELVRQQIEQLHDDLAILDHKINGYRYPADASERERTAP